MRKKYTLPADVRLECIAYVKGYPRRVQAYKDTADVLAYMDSKKDLVCQIIGKGLDALNDPAKLKTANPTQITTALGTLIDKWAMIGGSPADTAKDDALSDSLRKMAEDLQSD